MGIYAVTSEGEEAGAAATSETIVQLRGAPVVKGRLRAVTISMDGTVSVDAPAFVRLMRQTTDGTATAATETPYDPDDPAANITGFHSFTAEPTAGDVLDQWEVHQQGAILLDKWPRGEGPVIDAAASSRIGLVVTPSAVVNVVATLVFEEGL